MVFAVENSVFARINVNLIARYFKAYKRLISDKRFLRNIVKSFRSGDSCNVAFAERLEEETPYICRVDLSNAGIAESVLADAGDITLLAVYSDCLRNRKFNCGLVSGRIEYEIVFAVGISALVPVEHIVDRDEIIVFAVYLDLGDVVQPFKRRAAIFKG